jgi:hypothetical protein
LLDTHNANYWLDAMIAKYGKPDSCTYCDNAELATAVWHWDNGTMLKIEGEMLTELTSEGAAQRSAWLARGDSSEVADNGDEISDEGGEPASAIAHSHHHRMDDHLSAPAASPQHHARPSGWLGYYNDMNSRLEHWLGWSK